MENRCVYCGFSKIHTVNINLPIEIISNILLLRGGKYSDIFSISAKIRENIGSLVAEKLLILPIIEQQELLNVNYMYLDNYLYYRDLSRVQIKKFHYDGKNNIYSQIYLSDAINIPNKNIIKNKVYGILTLKNVLVNRSIFLDLSNYDIVDKIVKNTLLYYINKLISVNLFAYLFMIVSEILDKKIDKGIQFQYLKDIIAKHFNLDFNEKYDENYVLK